MHTPSHAILNLALLCSGPRRDLARAVVAGAVAPDLPILVFYLVERLALGRSEAEIWTRDYFLPEWQNVFDLAHSIPLALAGLGIARLLARRIPQAFFASLLLHSVFDLPFHHNDAHRHFFPLTDARLVSPLSYWDLAHHGSLMLTLEAGVVCVTSLSLLKRFSSRSARALLLAVMGLYVGGYVLFMLRATLWG